VVHCIGIGKSARQQASMSEPVRILPHNGSGRLMWKILTSALSDE